MKSAKVQKRPGAAIWDDASDTVKQKRARNRQSQRSFRERRTLRLQELEAQIQYLSMGETERNDSLISANAALRSALIRARQHFLTIETAMQSLNATLSTALNLPVVPPNFGADNPQSAPSSKKPPESAPPAPEPSGLSPSGHHSTSPYAGDGNTMHVNSSDNDIYNMDEDIFTDLCPTTSATTMDSVASSISSSGPIISDSVVSDGSGQPCSVSKDGGNQLCLVSKPGSRPSLPECGDQLSLDSFAYFNQILGNSEISFQNLATGSQQPSVDPTLYFSSMLFQQLPPLMGTQTSFHHRSNSLGRQPHVWPGPSVMWFSSFIYALAERSFVCRLSRSPRPSTRLPIYLSPTQLQAQIPHHAIISWIPIPPLRDRILENCSSGTAFDEMWLDLMAHAVIEVEDISSILTGVSQERGFLGVWDIYAAISVQRSSRGPEAYANDADEMFQELAEIDKMGLLRVYRMGLPNHPTTCDSPAEQHGTWTPVPIDQLLASSVLARKLYYHLELYKSDRCWRIDPAFFKRYPDLKWSGYEQYIAQGISFRQTTPSTSTRPSVPLDQIISQFEMALMTLDPNVEL
ncbi:bZIP transcription factor [Stagonosporopsis vannaccii]|nr:bZIP transcription factor [Stagonosporopsis vannaccii]